MVAGEGDGFSPIGDSDNGNSKIVLLSHVNTSYSNH